MHIVVPMSGFGERFRRVGYSVPKPLIEIEGKPIIAHVIDMFPGETKFTFICNREHLDSDEYQMEATLRRHCPSGVVVGIAPHKLGPIHTVRQVEHMFDSAQPVVVNYCDVSCYWNWNHFKHFVRSTGCVGAIPAYKGFHPHSLGDTNYAYMLELNGWVQDIQEKRPYTSNRMAEYASSGTYYFSSGRIMLDAFRKAVEQDLSVGGEYYVSLGYKPLFAAGQPVAVYDVQHVMHWGTPEDVAEYRTWSNTFRRLLDAAGYRPKRAGCLVMPMAGRGQRFLDEGYGLTKPLIPVSGKPMVVQATQDLPPAQHQAFVLRSDMPGTAQITATLSAAYPRAILETIPFVTEGQACTGLIGLDALERQLQTVPGPVTFGACDCGALYNGKAFERLAQNSEVDVIVWGLRRHANAVRCPTLFSWIDAARDGRINRVSVKAPLESPATDPIVLGTFTFRRAADFRQSVERLMMRQSRVNNEYYIDAAINEAIDLGLSCQLFEVDSFLCWGTPDALRTFEYWQSCFHKWDGHPYSLDLDKRIPPEELSDIVQRYQATIPPLPGSPFVAACRTACDNADDYDTG